MYKSPIEVIYEQMQTQMEGDIYRAVQSHGINVDKDELIRALQYDRGQYEKGYADAMPKWISVKDRLPESGVHILAAVKMDGLYCSGNYVCDAFYAAKYAQSISGYSDECACVYCEEDDEYYLEEGWYEVIKNWDDYNSIVISDTVTHWMPLPKPPKGE